MAIDVGSSVAVPNSMAPRLSTLTSRRVSGSVPIVRYLIRIPLPRPRIGRWEEVWVLEHAPGQTLKPGTVDGHRLLDQVQMVAELVGGVQPGMVAYRARQ
ncbi:hypothetical protein GCM10010160_43210 [Acrocarpospora corrugata]